MKKLKESLATLSETMTITKRDGTLAILVAAFAGVIIGMLVSPRKNIKLGCGNGNATTNNWGMDDEDFFDDECMEECCDDDDMERIYEEEECLSFK